MIRRCCAPLAVLTAVLWLTGSAQAARVIRYELRKTGPAKATPVTEAIMYVHPAKSVGPDPDEVPPSTLSPFNVLPESSGFNADNLISFLGEGQLGLDPVQVLRLQFDNFGFAGEDASLKFSIDVNPQYTGPDPTLELVEGTTGLSLSAYTPPVAQEPTPTVPTTPVPNGGGGQATVPEPTTIALWSAAVGLGLLRARALRRARRDVA